MKNPLRPPEPVPKRMPQRLPAPSPAPAKVSMGAKAPAFAAGAVPSDEEVMAMLPSLDDDAVRDLQRQANMLASLTQFVSTDVDSYRATLWARLREGIKQYRRWRKSWHVRNNNFPDIDIWQMAQTGNSPFYSKR